MSCDSYLLSILSNTSSCPSSLTSPLLSGISIIRFLLWLHIPDPVASVPLSNRGYFSWLWYPIILLGECWLKIGCSVPTFAYACVSGTFCRASIRQLFVLFFAIIIFNYSFFFHNFRILEMLVSFSFTSLFVTSYACIFMQCLLW